jgi:FixJ family two-component response regulator
MFQLGRKNHFRTPARADPNNADSYKLVKRRANACERGSTLSQAETVRQNGLQRHPNKVTCAMLNLSIKTVETHRAAAMRKMGFTTTAELVRYAIREKLITP